MSVRPHNGCDCCVVYGPRRKRTAEVMADARREAEAILASPEGQAAIAELTQLRIEQEGKRQLGQALSDLLCGES
jgi:hypothetical protein